MMIGSRKEEYAIVLDFLQHGKPFSGSNTPIAQVIGEDYFTLLELVPKQAVFLKAGDKVYVGADKRDKIHHIRGRINYYDLTNTAKKVLEDVVSKKIKEAEQRFIAFFNTTGSISTRLHSLELLPGVGKKHMWQLLKAREEKKFESFEDIKERVELIPDPEKAIIKRIILELEGHDKYRLFVGR